MNTRNNQVIIYSTADGTMKLEVKLENETVWLSQRQMAELFGCGADNIGLHLKNVYFEGELAENQTTEDFSVVQKEGNKEVKRLIRLYNLDAIISVGYRINSLRGTQFRIWATQKLKEYIIKGFVMDDERLANGRVAKTYDYAKRFFAMVQNKFHYAITGLTAAEIVSRRINSASKNLGLTNWQGEIITREQAEIAKNYLEELELKRLNLLVEQFLSFAELQSVEERLMYMKDWIRKLDEFLVFNEKNILADFGTVSRGDMEEKVREELAKYNHQIA